MSGRGQSWKPNLPIIQEESDEEEELIGAVGGGADAGAVQPVDEAEAAICTICHETGTEDNPLIQACGCQPGYHEMCVNVAIVTPIITSPNPCAYCGQSFNHPNLRVSLPFRIQDYATTILFIIFLIETVCTYLVPDSTKDFEYYNLSFLQPILYWLAMASGVTAAHFFGYFYFDPDWPPKRDPHDQIVTFRGYDPQTRLPDPGRSHRMSLLDERDNYFARRQQLYGLLHREERMVENIQNTIRGMFGIENVEEVTEQNFDMSRLSAQQCNRLLELLRQFRRSMDNQRLLQQKLRN